jgi:large subunit ribosomal protein L22
VQVKAVLKNHRGSARKARLVVDLVRGKPVEEALSVLDLSNKRVARPIAKLVRSALASAEQKNTRERAGIDVENLVVKAITVDQGPSMWRIRPRAQGRATWIQRRSSHITVVLEEV